MLTFKQFCRLEEEGAAERVEKVHQVKQRDKKIKKLLSISNHWKGLNWHVMVKIFLLSALWLIEFS